MNLITLENISKNYSEKKLLNNISLGINDGDKIGVIGINGTGKSTLLKIVGEIEQPDTGNIIKKNNIRIEYLSQNPDFDFEATVIQQVFKGNSEEMKILREYEYNIQKVLNGDSSYNDKLIDVQEKMDSMNLWDLESEAKTVLTKLDVNNFDEQIKFLSGGQRKRVALASALITPCELLILDEPTNHMDSDSISWLEDYLNKRKGALLMITHDRYFLDVVTNRIIEIDKGNLYSYEGNYSEFIEKKIERESLEASTQRKRESLYRTELAWIKRGAKARSTKQKARKDRFETLKDEMVDIKDGNLELSVVGSRLGNKIIELNDISKSFDDNTLIKDFTYTILKEDRIGIVGPNGAGKSTLMKIISGEFIPDSGELEIGETVKVGFFSQENYHMDENMRVIEYVKEVGEYLSLANGEKITASKMLERFLFTSDTQYSPIGKLSGGERRRLYLLRVLMGAPNVLLLDEPTNDLDTTTLTILEDFLDNFNGPVITVSHDRYFLDRICNKIFSYRGNGEIKRYSGNYSDYLLKLENEIPVQEEIKKKSVEEKKTESKVNTNKTKLKFTYNEQKEFDEIDEVIENLENKISSLEKEIEKNSMDFVKLQELLNEKESTQSKLDEKYERWTYLNDLSEKIEAQKNK
jgi:ATP-binding cassette subfamily F protein uup